MHLGERHRPGLEPAVQHGRVAPHRRPAGRVVRVRTRQVVDAGPVQVGDAYAALLTASPLPKSVELIQRAVDVDARVGRVVGLPDRDRRTPEPVAADRPVAGIRQPLPERTVLDVGRRPVDLLVQRDHPLLDLRHRDEPRRHRLVDQRRVTAPAVRVGVRVGLVPENHAALFEVAHDRLVRLKDLNTLIRGYERRELRALVDGHDGRDAVRLAEILVVLAERRRHMHHAGTVLGGHEVAAEHPERVRGVGQEVEQRRVRATDEFGAQHRADRLESVQLLRVRADPGRAQDHALAVTFEHGVGDVRPHRDRQVRWQRPRRRRPDQQLLAGLQGERDGQRRIGPILVDVVHPGLGVRQRRLAAPAVGEHAEALVHQALVVEALERPHDGFHVVGVERLVVVREVDPAGLTRDVALPVHRVLQHRRPAGVVELVHAEFEDLRLRGDAELLLRLDFGRQAVAVPAEPALDPATPHGLVARNQVLHVAGQQVAVVRQAVRERRAVVEHELVGAPRPGIARVDAGLERFVARPVVEHVLFHHRQRRAGRHGNAWLMLRVHQVSSSTGHNTVRGRASSARGTTPLGDHSRSPSLGRAAITGLSVRFYWDLRAGCP